MARKTVKPPQAAAKAGPTKGGHGAIAPFSHEKGANAAQENSPSAFAAAVARGMGIELDVLCSADGEVMALLREGLVNALRTTRIEEIRGEMLAIDTALSHLQAGDLCLILVDRIDEALAHIAMRNAEA